MTITQTPTIAKSDIDEIVRKTLSEIADTRFDYPVTFESGRYNANEKFIIEAGDFLATLSVTMSAYIHYEASGFGTIEDESISDVSLEELLYIDWDGTDTPVDLDSNTMRRLESMILFRQS